MAEFGLTDAEFNTAVYVFAHYLGIDLEKEQVLLHVAETALRTLPDGWSLGIGDGDNEGIPYFFNEETGESVWKHPKEQLYMKKVKDERRRLQDEAEERRQRKLQGRPQDSGKGDGDKKDAKDEKMEALLRKVDADFLAMIKEAEDDESKQADAIDGGGADGEEK